jgi:TPR repeat protein
LLSKAAETNAEAQYQLGMMLSEGNGGDKDDVAARALFEKAAAQNHPGALERMGRSRQRAGWSKGLRRAKSYYERAAALGDEDARRRWNARNVRSRSRTSAAACGDQSVLLMARERARRAAVE